MVSYTLMIVFAAIFQFSGWQIDGTVINYLVTQTPDDPDLYPS